MFSDKSYPNNIFIQLPIAGIMSYKHQMMLTSIALLKHYSKLTSDSSSAVRAIFLLSQKQDQDVLKFALSLGAKILFTIPKDANFILAHDAYKYNSPNLLENRFETYFLVMQNNKAEITYPVAMDALISHLSTWAGKYRIHGCDFSRLKKFAVGGVNWRHVNIMQKLESPIPLYSRPLPDLNQLLFFMSERNAKCISSINGGNNSKAYFFAGFYPQRFHSMIKNSRPKSYKEDIMYIRYSMLEANCRTFEWYLKMKNFLYKTMERPVKNRLKMTKCKVDENPKSIRRRKTSNVDSDHQDRKKKHKLNVK
jgi:hypothetical protein